MPTFEISDGPTAIDASRSADSTATYSVTNRSTDGADARLSVIPSGGSKTEWFTIDGNRERTFSSGETQTVTVRVKMAADTPAGDYPFRLRSVAVNDPDNDHVEGPMTIAKLGSGVEARPKSLLWLWILIGLVVVLAIAAALYFLLKPRESESPATTTVTEAKPAPTPAAPAPPQPAAPAAPLDRMKMGQSLKGAGSEQIVSNNGFFRAVMQSDCNFVVYNPPRPLWASGTNGRGSGCTANMQEDGNLVVYTERGEPVWASGTYGNPGAWVIMQDDGNLVIYKDGRALWASNTVVR